MKDDTPQTTAQKNTRMKLADLKPHPLQQTFYSACTADDDKALADDLRQRGQLSPIIIMPAKNAAGLPPGTIMDGCRRARLMQANRVTKANVLFRHDLKDADATTVEAEFLKYNFTRRQLHPLDKARVAQRLFVLERKRKSIKSLSWTEVAEMRDRVGKVFGMSGRNLDRYLRVLETPMSVQNAVRDGRLKLVLGAKIASLPSEQQHAIATRIGELNDAKAIATILGEYVQVPDGRRHQKTADAVASFVRRLADGIEDLEDRASAVGPRLAARHRPMLQRGIDLISQLLRSAQQAE
jgi:hypothetical protein